MGKNKLSSVSTADSYEKMGEYWDTHDFTDVDDTGAPDVEFEVSCTVPLEEELFYLIEAQARLRGVKIETLVNLWLQQKLSEHMLAIVARKKEEGLEGY